MMTVIRGESNDDSDLGNCDNDDDDNADRFKNI